MDLVSPRLYLPVATFKNQPNDYDISSYSDPQLQDLLVRASGQVDAYLGRTLLATEVKERFYGQGGNLLMLKRAPICYVRQVMFVMPGMQSFSVPVSQLLVDYEKGELYNYTPLQFQGYGLTTIFPPNLPIDVIYAYGYNYTVAGPGFTHADTNNPSGTPLAPGTYYLAITSVTQWGESAVTTLVAHTTATGAISLTITPVLGAYMYNVYMSQTNVIDANLKLVAQSPATNYGNNPLAVVVNSLAAPAGQFPQVAPTTDSSARPIPTALIEATRLITLDMLWAQNNLANRGIQSQRSDQKDIRWRSTEGNSGRGVSYVTQQVQELLSPYKLAMIF